MNATNPDMSALQVFQLQQVLKDAGLDSHEDLHTSEADLDEDTRRSIVQLVGEVCGKMLRAAWAEGERGWASLARTPTLRMQLCVLPSLSACGRESTDEWAMAQKSLP